MITPDAVNGLFEALGGAVQVANCRRIWVDKQVRGVTWWGVALFASWGWWNLFYYPHLDQWLSFAGGLVIVAANTFWVVLAAKYRAK